MESELNAHFSASPSSALEIVSNERAVRFSRDVKAAQGLKCDDGGARRANGEGENLYPRSDGSIGFVAF